MRSWMRNSMDLIFSTEEHSTRRLRKTRIVTSQATQVSDHEWHAFRHIKPWETYMVQRRCSLPAGSQSQNSTTRWDRRGLLRNSMESLCAKDESTTIHVGVQRDTIPMGTNAEGSTDLQDYSEQLFDLPSQLIRINKQRKEGTNQRFVQQINSIGRTFNRKLEARETWHRRA